MGGGGKEGAGFWAYLLKNPGYARDLVIWALGSGLLHKAPTCCPKRKLERSYLTRSSTRWHLPRIATSLQIRRLQFIRNIFGIEKQE